jgi:hypothetical protein
MSLKQEHKDMTQKLIEKVFEKAKQESQEEKPYGLSNHLEASFETTNVQLKRGTFERYYTGYILNGKKIKPNKETKEALSKYLGYMDYLDFCNKNKENKESVFYKKSFYISVCLNIVLLVMLSFGVTDYYKKDCMIWVEDHYEKVRCTGLVNEKPLDSDVLKLFRKIEVCKDSIFFINGIPVIHYTRHNNETEFFTSNGEHPIYNDVFTDPITPRIIDSRVKPCDNQY